MGETHIVEIPVDEEHNQKQLCVIGEHPLTEISRSSGHLLLLKLWQREEEVLSRRIAQRERRMDSARRDISQNCCFFLLFHALFLTMLFTSSLHRPREACHKWWLPTLLSLSTSSVVAVLVQAKLMCFWKARDRLQRERAQSRALTRCIQELRMKGAAFDLSKEPFAGKRMKSSSVQIKWKPVTFCSRYLVTIFLVALAALLSPASKLVLCKF